MGQLTSLSATAAAGLLAFTVTASAQPAQFETWKETRPLVAPVKSCQALRALSGFEFSVDVAESVTAQGATPAFCRVQGVIQPEIRFEVSLPAGWNGRLYMFGNGGFAGEPLTAGFRVGRRNLAVAKGFAAAQTNTGHDASREPLAAFASSPQKLSDYAYRAVHVTAVTAKTLARAYYGTTPAYSYFDGCSTGGRQGLIAAQRFPDDFDGIVVGAPVLDFTGTMAHYVGVSRALQAAPLSEAKVKVLAEASYRKCDAADGLADGLIRDPRSCDFDAERDLPRCVAGSPGDTCLTDSEVASVKAVLGDLVVGGRRRFPGFPVSSEVSAPTPSGPRTGWDPWIIRSGQPTVAFTFMESFFKHMATPGTEIDWKTFDVEKDMPKLDAIGTLLSQCNRYGSFGIPRSQRPDPDVVRMGRPRAQSADGPRVLRARGAVDGRGHSRVLPAVHDAGRLPLLRRRGTRSRGHHLAAGRVGRARGGARRAHCESARRRQDSQNATALPAPAGRDV